MELREAGINDLTGLLELYTKLHDNPMPESSERINELWAEIIKDKTHHIIIAAEGERIISSCVVVVIPNLTHNQRPYALVENVITDEHYRKKGFATAVLNFAKTVAQKEHCYKIMLMTGSKLDSTLKFYEQSGYNKNDKTAFIQWLD
jgi:GNAT superfamily N-acetyltransferase